MLIQNILDERDKSGFVDSWTEYLVIEKLETDQIILAIKSHYIIDSIYNGEHIAKYLDEETGIYDLPNVINGIPVKGWDKGNYCLLGDPLVNRHDRKPLNINKSNNDEIINEWLEENKWDLQQDKKKEISNFIKQYYVSSS